MSPRFDSMLQLRWSSEMEAFFDKKAAEQRQATGTFIRNVLFDWMREQQAKELEELMREGHG